MRRQRLRRRGREHGLTVSPDAAETLRAALEAHMCRLLSASLEFAALRREVRALAALRSVGGACSLPLGACASRSFEKIREDSRRLQGVSQRAGESGG